VRSEVVGEVTVIEFETWIPWSALQLQPLNLPWIGAGVRACTHRAGTVGIITGRAIGRRGGSSGRWRVA